MIFKEIENIDRKVIKGEKGRVVRFICKLISTQKDVILINELAM